MNAQLIVDAGTGEIVGRADRLDPNHDAKQLANVEQGVEYVDYFKAAVAACRAAGADRALANRHAEQMVRHVRETGRLITQLPRLTMAERGARKGRKQRTALSPALAGDSPVLSFAKEAGYEPRTLRKWESLSTRLTDEVFEERMEMLKSMDEDSIITLADFYSLLKAEKKRARAADLDAQADDILANPPQLADVVADVISIDPPWPYGTQYDPEGRRAANPYPEMSLEEIRDDVLRRVRFADNCVMWLWTTHQFMRDAFPLLDAWGFKDKAILTWVKDRMGLGSWLRSQSEFCIMAVKGSPVVTLTNQTTVLEGPLREHSRKPEEFFAMVDSLCHGVKVDFYTREQRPGWFSFGNETEKFA